MKKFWMVQKLLNMESYPAKYKHDSLESATKEAERLCKLSKESFVILEATKIVCIEDPPLIWKSLDDKSQIVNLGKWLLFVEKLKIKYASLGVFLQEGRFIRFDDDKALITIGFTKEYCFHREQLQQDEKFSKIKDMADDFFGTSVYIEFIEEENEVPF